MQDARCKMQEARCRMQEAGGRMQGSGFGFGFGEVPLLTGRKDKRGDDFVKEGDAVLKHLFIQQMPPAIVPSTGFASRA